jgi:hypothetical protein
MSNPTIVKWCNRLAILAILALLYWVLLFSVNEVFDLRILRERSTTAFGFVVLGILALLAGSLMLNIMFNLTRIAERAEHPARASSNANTPTTGSPRRWLLGFTALTSLSVALMFAGDARTRMLKKDLMLQTAQTISSQNQAALRQFAQQELTTPNVNALAQQLQLVRKSAEFVHEVYVLRPEKILGQDSIVAIDHELPPEDKQAFSSLDLAFKASQQQRTYLNAVFAGQADAPLYVSRGGHYWLLYPVRLDDKVLVLFLSDEQAYGKVSY